MSYVNLETFKVHIRSEIGGVDDDELQEALDSAHVAIDAYCGRSFSVAASSTRVYVPSGRETLYIDDCTAVSSVTVDGLAVTAYQKQPLNNLAGGRTVPYTHLVRLGDVWTLPNRDGEATISITASYGWAATPSAVLSACRILAKEIVETRNQSGGYTAIAPDLMARALSHPKYRQLLDPLRRYDRVGGIA